MDLSSLNQFLKDLPDIRTLPGRRGPDVCSDIIRQLKRQAATPTSRLVVVVLESVRETLKVEGIAPSPTAVFAALSSCLEQSQDVGLSSACCSALSMTMARGVPTAVLRLKSAECVRIIMKHMDSAAEAAIPCLGVLIGAAGPASWPAVVPSYMCLLSLVVGDDSKLRKKSQTALFDIFKALSSDEALVGVLQAASEALVGAAGQILAAPQRTAEEAARASNKQRSKAEEQIRDAVSRALWLMATLKNVISLVPEPVAQKLCSQVLSLFPLQQILLTTSATEVLLALSSTASPVTQEEILKALLSINALWDTNDAALEMSIVRLLEGLAIGAGNASYVAHSFHVLVPQLASRIEGVARAAADAMVRLAQEAITEDMVVSAPLQGNRAAPVVSIISAVESSFGAQYFDSWELCLNVAQELISSLGRAGSPLASGLIEKIGELCAGVDDVIAASDSAESARIAEVAQNTLGVCIRSLGPEAVLEHLPLEIEEALDGEAEGRTWMIPLLKMYMKGGRLAFWLSDIHPLIANIESRCAAAEPFSRQRSTLQALELQLWSTLPSFCDWAEDIPDCFGELTKAAGPSFEEREDIRLYASQALQKICSQTKKILANTDQEAGHLDPCIGADEDLDEADDMDDGLFDDHAYLGRFSAEDGHNRVSVLKSGSKVWLPMLLNAFVATHTSRRNQIQSAISGYSCVCDGAVVSKVFKSALMRLMKVANQLKTGELGRDAVLDGGDSDTERYCTYMEAVYALLGGLDASALSVVYQLVSNDMDERDPAVQKKAYKIFQYLVEHRPDFYGLDFEGLIERTLQGGATAMSASRGFRIKCLKSIILHLLSDQQNIDLDKIPALGPGADVNAPGAAGLSRARILMTPLVAEIVLSIKESNKKTRAAAFDLVIEVASAMDENDGESGVVSMVHLVLGGLVGSTSQMVSASVMALARMMFEFTPNMVPLIHDLLPAVLMLLHSKSREVIKAVLGFLKIVIMRLDSETLLHYTPRILEGTLIWAEDSKNKFRLKVRVVLERLAKKVGFEALARHIPESHRSLLTHIRKETKRKDRLKSARSEMDWDGQSLADTVSTKGGRSRASSKDPSTWQSDVFSQDSMGKSSAGLGRKSTRAQAKQPGAGIAGMGGMGGTGEPLNLLEGSTIRRLVGMNVRRSGHIEKERMAEDGITFDRGDDGKLIINEESKKRGRDEGEYEDSDEDSDDVILRGISGQELALRGSQSMAKAASYAGITSRYGDRGSKKVSRGSSISGDRFKSGKAGGDVKGKSKVEPFAYWPLDRRLMNRRQHKTKAAKDALKAVVNAGGKRRKKA